HGAVPMKSGRGHSQPEQTRAFQRLLESHVSLNTLSFQNVGPKPGTPGVSVDSQPSAPQQAPPSGGGLGALGTFLPLLIMVPFLFLMFRRSKKEAEARSKLKKGDRVVSQSGIIGELVEMDERIAKVKVGPGLTMQMLATSLSPFEASSDKKSSDSALKDLKDA